MPSDIEITRVDEDSEFRCQGATAHGQCLNRVVPGSEFCIVHGGGNAIRKQKLDSKRIYMLEKFQDQVHRHSDHQELKSLREEIAILRMMLETQLNACEDATDLMLKSSGIRSLVSEIEKLVRSCDRLEQTSGSMLDAQQAVSWMNEIAGIMDSHISDPEIVRAIAEEIMSSYHELRKENDISA